MSDPTLPHVDGSGRGLDDGDCIHCGDSGSLGGQECRVRLREALDEQLAEHLNDLLDPRAVERAIPVPRENPKCRECGGPTKWACSSGIWALGLMSCERCTATYALVIRKADHEVYILPPGTLTHTMRLGRELRQARDTIRRALAICNDPAPVTKTPAPHPLYAEGLAVGGDLVRAVVRDALEGRHG